MVDVIYTPAKWCGASNTGKGVKQSSALGDMHEPRRRLQALEFLTERDKSSVLAEVDRWSKQPRFLGMSCVDLNISEIQAVYGLG